MAEAIRHAAHGMLCAVSTVALTAHTLACKAAGCQQAHAVEAHTQARVVFGWLAHQQEQSDRACNSRLLS